MGYFINHKISSHEGTLISNENTTSDPSGNDSWNGNAPHLTFAVGREIRPRSIQIRDFRL